MKLAIRLAAKSRWRDSGVHPHVGAVVVKHGKILAKAYHGEKSPGDHAEFTALEMKIPERIFAGATVYTTLEPCTTRKHPKVPCAERLAQRKVSRVVIGILDPNQDIRGRGVLFLRKHGIAIEFFPPDLMAEVEDQNRKFINHHEDLARQIPPKDSVEIPKTSPTKTDGVRPIPGNDLGYGVKIGGVWRNQQMAIAASNWARWEKPGWVRSGWLYVPRLSDSHAVAFFKVHLDVDGSGYVHILDASCPEHKIWMRTDAGFSREESFCWEKEKVQITTLWKFTWKNRAAFTSTSNLV